jgi:hypothetical protein
MAGKIPNPEELNVPTSTEFTALRKIILDSMLEKVCEMIRESAPHRTVETDLDNVYVFPIAQIPRLRAYFKLGPNESALIGALGARRLHRLVSPTEAYAFIKRRLENEHPLYRVEWMSTDYPTILISWVQ